MNLLNWIKWTIKEIWNPAWLILLQAFITKNPEWLLAWATIFWAYNILFFQAHQDRLNEWTEFTMNTEEFSKEIVGTKSFQDAHFLAFEAFMRQRSHKKREIIKNILLWFTKIEEAEKEEFELERILDILNKITFNEIKYINKIYSISFDNAGFTISTAVWIDSKQGEYINEIYGLMSLWVIFPVESNTIETPYDLEEPIIDVMSHFEVSSIWFKFIEYILK